MEIPPLRRPQLKNILVRSLLDRTIHVAGRALMVAAPAGALLWVLESTECLSALCALLEPIGSALGMNGAILAAFLLSFPANELFLPVLMMMTNCCLDDILSSGITIKMAVCMMVFVIFHWPCATTLLTIRKETGSWKKTAAAAALPTAVGIVLCCMINLLF